MSSKSVQKVIKNAIMARKKERTDEEILQILDDSDSGNLSELFSDYESEESGSEDDDGPPEEDNTPRISLFIDDDRPPIDVIPLKRKPQTLAGDTIPSAQGVSQGSSDNTGRKKKQVKKSNVKNIAGTLNRENYDRYKIPSEAKELSVTIKATKPPRKIDWVNQPPRSSQGIKPQHVIKGPVGEPQGKAKDVDTPLDGIII